MSRRSLSALLGCSLVAALAVGVTTAGGQSGSSDRALFGSLSGLNEIGEDGERGAGDRNGRGSASAIIDGGRICYALTVKNIQDPVAAHIHRGGRTVNGPVVVEFEAPSAGDPGASSGCTSHQSRPRAAHPAQPAELLLQRPHRRTSRAARCAGR